MDSLFPDQQGWKEKFHGRFLRQDNLVFLKPLAFMNNSGKSAAAALHFFGWPLEELLVVHDDLETPFGTVQCTFGGGHRGNNGLRSIITLCGGNDFWRFRLGIGRPPGGRKPGDWVLERFSPHEEALLPEITTESARFLLEQCGKPQEKKLVFA
ncbi:aminoacyl-tRNA hydrolase [Alkalispirochaeta americana]|uniref:Aminoacyl-tRNA hydrolase n=2 Tax=Alkalispirochaeta americana TaxID=159291 RepID=A0A1N6QC03_9SPIO|nr:aminoacyl-tRNA hydrolase [Alkalispirochaeta americana]